MFNTGLHQIHIANTTQANRVRKGR